LLIVLALAGDSTITSVFRAPEGDGALVFVAAVVFLVAVALRVVLFFPLRC
jgi:hypothetical protein